jgi:predicted kinase
VHLPEPCILIVAGVPGAGKSTVSRVLAERIDRAVHIEADALQRMIVSGSEWPQREMTKEQRSQLALRGRNVCLLAESFAREGFTVIIDDVVIGSRVDEFQKQISHRPLGFVLLTPSVESLRDRNAGRESKDVFDAWRHLDAVMREETPQVGLWIDSSQQSAEQTVEQILAEADPRALLSGGTVVD